MTSSKQIPESRIALNPVVIDDSKRGNPPDASLWESAKKEIPECILTAMCVSIVVMVIGIGMKLLLGGCC